MSAQIPNQIAIPLNTDNPIVLRQSVMEIQKWLNIIRDQSTWLNGAGLPAASLGVDGNYYLDKSTGLSYIKESGVWLP